MNPETEVQSFFDSLGSEDTQEADIFGDAPAATDTEEVAGAAGASGQEDEPRKNRRHRRLEQQLQTEREEKIAMKARLEALEQSPRASDTSVDERLTRLYGTDNTEAARLHMDLLRDFAAQAKREAIEEAEQREAARTQEQRQYQSYIDTELESIEDEFNVDVTSDAPAARKARREFLELVEKLSPKGEDGTISGFADFHETWDVYQSRREKTDSTRAKEIAARTMQKSGGQGAAPAAAPTPGFDGWKRDFNL